MLQMISISQAKKRRATLVSLLLALNLLLAFASAPLPAAQASDTEGLIVPGQIVVQFVPELNLQDMNAPQDAPAALQGLFGRLGVSGLKGLGGQSNVYLLDIGVGVDEALQMVGNDALVKQAEPNRLVAIAKVDSAVSSNDPLYTSGKQWWLDKIQAPQAWELTTGSPDIVAAVVDSGIDATHPDLQGHIIASYDFRNEKASVIDDVGHGTAVASCIGANTNDGQGMAGINWNSRLINVKAGTSSLFSFDVARGIIFAVDKGARVINGSFGGSATTFVEELAVGYAQSKNVVLVFAAGNDGSGAPHYPADFPNVISVGASDINDRIAYFSNYGPNTTLVAPGVGIWMAQAGGGWLAENGTSFSAPMVTGVVTLMLSVNPNLTPAEVKSILEGTADDISGEGFTSKTGWGRLNAYKAVLAAKNGDVRPNHHSTVSGKVSGVDPAKVRLSLDPLGVSFKPDKDGNYQLQNLGKATYRLRAAVTGVGTGQGVKEFTLTGQTGDHQAINFAFANLNLNPSLEPNYVDLARNFDALPPSAAPTVTAEGKRWFAETGHSLGGVFRAYWEAHGGLPVFGYPLSEPFRELSATDGKIYTVQYFERNRFEYHPENAGTPYEVLLGLLGSEQTAGRNFPPGASAGSGQYFGETGYTLDSRFLGYWQSRGGLALFGLPISEAFSENVRLVQYFERNRFEYFPENAGTVYEVLLGLLGRDLARQRNYLP